jgi:hypothetical protein
MFNISTLSLKINLQGSITIHHEAREARASDGNACTRKLLEVLVEKIRFPGILDETMRNAIASFLYAAYL